LWWRRAVRHQQTPRAVFWSVHALFAFMLFNATVVFGPPFWRWIVAFAVIALLAGRVLTRRAPQLRPVAGGTSGDQPWN
jgi:hypothetical protein